MVTAGFVAPYLLDTTVRFVEAAARLPGVRTALITCEPAGRLPPSLKEHLAGHWRIDDALDPGQLAAAVEGLSGQLGPVGALLAVLEQLQVPLAQVREHLGLPGMGPATAANFRDKDRMKTVFEPRRLRRPASLAGDRAAQRRVPGPDRGVPHRGRRLLRQRDDRRPGRLGLGLGLPADPAGGAAAPVDAVGGAAAARDRP
jgi:hypothetical protein